MWNERGWEPYDKRLILEAVSYLMNLSDREYKKRFIEHVENLKMAEEDKKMYQSVFEEVYLERGIQIGEKRGMQIGEQRGAKKKAFDIARDFLSDGIPLDVVSKNTGFSLDEVKHCCPAEPGGNARRPRREETLTRSGRAWPVRRTAAL